MQRQNDTEFISYAQFYCDMIIVIYFIALRRHHSHFIFASFVTACRFASFHRFNLLALLNVILVVRIAGNATLHHGRCIFAQCLDWILVRMTAGDKNKTCCKSLSSNFSSFFISCAEIRRTRLWFNQLLQGWKIFKRPTWCHKLIKYE